MENQVEDPDEKQVENPNKGHVEDPMDKPVEDPMDKPVEDPMDKPVEDPIDKLVEDPIDKQVESQNENQVKNLSENQVENPMEHTSEKQSEKKSRSKFFKVVMISMVTVVLVICISAYLFVHSYINKMNLVTLAEPDGQGTEQTADIEPEPEDINTTEPDSPEVEIVTIEDKIRNNMEENSTPIMNDKDVFNILLIGGDSRQVGGNARSDAMIIVSINKKTKSIIATSILRDIYLMIPGKSNNRINAAFAYGGADLLMDTIEKNFKIQIDRYASVDFFAFMDVVDATGGVTLDVTDEEIPIINDYIHELNRLKGEDEEKDVLTNAGSLLLNGKQALGYARNRYIGTDFERTARQRRVLEQVFNNVKSLSITELNNLLNTLLPQITTNLKEGEIFSMILGLPKYAGYHLDQWSVPVNGSYTFMRIRKMAVIGVDFEENIKEIQKRIYGEQ